MATQTQNRLVGIMLLALGLLLLIPILAMATGLFGVGQMGGWMWGDGMQGPGMWGGGFGGAMLLAVVMQLLFVVVVVGGIVLLYRAVTRSGSDDAMAELRRAYARGDLSDEEYDQRRERLDRDS